MGCVSEMGCGICGKSRPTCNFMSITTVELPDRKQALHGKKPMKKYFFPVLFILFLVLSFFSLSIENTKEEKRIIAKSIT